MGFVHVEDAAAALLVAAERLAGASEGTWHTYNAAPEVLTVGEVARTVQRQAQPHSRSVCIFGASSEPRHFEVRSRLEARGFTPRRTMEGSLGEVLGYFEAQPW